jgi:hypothetical protein
MIICWRNGGCRFDWSTSLDFFCLAMLHFSITTYYVSRCFLRWCHRSLANMLSSLSLCSVFLCFCYVSVCKTDVIHIFLLWLWRQNVQSIMIALLFRASFYAKYSAGGSGSSFCTILTRNGLIYFQTESDMGNFHCVSHLYDSCCSLGKNTRVATSHWIDGPRSLHCLHASNSRLVSSHSWIIAGASIWSQPTDVESKIQIKELGHVLAFSEAIFSLNKIEADRGHLTDQGSAGKPGANCGWNHEHRGISPSLGRSSLSWTSRTLN